MTLLQELQARILAKIGSASGAEPGAAYTPAELSSQIDEPEIPGLQTKLDPRPTGQDSRTGNENCLRD